MKDETLKLVDHLRERNDGKEFETWYQLWELIHSDNEFEESNPVLYELIRSKNYWEALETDVRVATQYHVTRHVPGLSVGTPRGLSLAPPSSVQHVAWYCRVALRKPI